MLLGGDKGSSWFVCFFYDRRRHLFLYHGPFSVGVLFEPLFKVLAQQPRLHVDTNNLT